MKLFKINESKIDPGKSFKINTIAQILEIKKPSFTNIVFVFIICAILGWLVEIGYVYLQTGKIVSRGMTYGPYCSIYGYGAVILYFLFHNVERKKSNIPYIFIISAVMMGGFELLSGQFFKHVLNIEMWSYDGQFLEIFDYTTVPILIGWGILSTLFVFFIQPLLEKIISLIPKNIIKGLAIIIVVIYFTDLTFSVFNIYHNPEILHKLVDPNL